MVVCSKKKIIGAVVLCVGLSSGLLFSTIEEYEDTPIDTSYLKSRVRIASVEVDTHTVKKFGYARGWVEPFYPWVLNALNMCDLGHEDSWQRFFRTGREPIISFTTDKYLCIRVQSKTSHRPQDYFIYCSSSKPNDIMLVPIAKITKQYGKTYVDSHSFVRDYAKKIISIPKDIDYTKEDPYYCTLYLSYASEGLVCNIQPYTPQ